MSFTGFQLGLTDSLIEASRKVANEQIDAQIAEEQGLANNEPENRGRHADNIASIRGIGSHFSNMLSL